MRLPIQTLISVCLLLNLVGCGNEARQAQREELKVQASAAGASGAVSAQLTDTTNWSSIATEPHELILTRHSQWRLLRLYRKGHRPSSSYTFSRKLKRDEYSSSSYRYDYGDLLLEEDFMPGLDLLRGKQLLGVSVVDMNVSTQQPLFDRPILFYSLYLPSYNPDTVNGKPLIRSYYIVSAYDEDTNRDSVLNRKDLRHLYHIDLTGKQKTALLPPHYSVSRSQYDPGNDAMILFALHDANRNGRIDADEAMHVFWLSLRQPAPAKRVY